VTKNYLAHNVHIFTLFHTGTIKPN